MGERRQYIQSIGLRVGRQNADDPVIRVRYIAEFVRHYGEGEGEISVQVPKNSKKNPTRYLSLIHI